MMVNKKPLIRAWRSRCSPIYHSNNSQYLPSLASTRSFCAEKLMVMSQHRTTKPKPHNSTSNKINSNKYIMMTRITRSTMMSMARHITANKTTARNNISNTISNSSTMINSIDMTRL